jgi:hypothetical protein
MGVKKILILIACLIFSSAGTVGAIELYLDPVSLTVDPCTYFDIDLRVSGLGDFTAPSVGDFDVDILYDTSQMAFSGYTLGPNLGSNIGYFPDFSVDAWNLSWGDLGGVVDLAEVSNLTAAELIALQPEEFTLATLTFHCLRPGFSLISIDANDLLLTLGNEYGQPLPFTIGAPVGVTQTPEPCTLVLIGTGLAGARFLRRRSKK